MTVPRKGKDVFDPLEHFKAHVAADYLALRKLFMTGTAESFELMGRILGEHTALGTPHGGRIQGGGAIALFFEDLWRQGKRDIEFKLVGAWTVHVSKPVIMTRKDETITDVGFEITEFHALTKSASGRVAENQTGGWTRTEGHQSTCVWKP